MRQAKDQNVLRGRITWLMGKQSHNIDGTFAAVHLKKASVSHFKVQFRYSLTAYIFFFYQLVSNIPIYLHSILTAYLCQGHSRNTASRAARHPFSLRIPPTLTVGTPSVLCLEHLQREASRGILPGAWTTFHSCSCFCGGVAVQYRGPPDSLESSPYHADWGQPPRGGRSCVATVYLLRSQTKNLDLRWGSEFWERLTS